MLIGSCARVRGQVTGSFPLKGTFPKRVSATPAPSLPGSQAATSPSISDSCLGSKINGRPETTTTTHFAAAEQTVSTAALSVAESCMSLTGRGIPWSAGSQGQLGPVSYTHLRAHETDSYLVCRLLLEKKK